MPYLRKKGLSAAVVTGLIYLSAVATSAEDLTIERAVSIALERNSDLRRLENQVDLNQTAVEQGRARFQVYKNYNGPFRGSGQAMWAWLGWLQAARWPPVPAGGVAERSLRGASLRLGRPEGGNRGFSSLQSRG